MLAEVGTVCICELAVFAGGGGGRTSKLLLRKKKEQKQEEEASCNIRPSRRSFSFFAGSCKLDVDSKVASAAAATLKLNQQIHQFCASQLVPAPKMPEHFGGKIGQAPPPTTCLASNRIGTI